ncbi:hypothetical protein FGL91_18710 [Microbacterium sp. CBA3102]|nr:hypothetical protein FGL91_18710 [Microbacterium sp. CBA3102]
MPADIASTMWPSVLKTCIEKLGAQFDPWQDGAGRVIFAKREDGTLAAMIDGVGMSLPRQVGKTHLVGYTVFALCVNMPGLLVIWTAHHSATSSETFLAMQGMAQRTKVAPHVAQVFKGSGDEEIRFHNGSRILFGARERGFGRGIPGVDVLIFDEAQILSDKAMSNMLATMNTSSFGLQLYIGTPPKPEDNSETFKRMRREALAGTLVDGAWIEFGADADAKDDDRSQWRKMNPSYPKRTPQQSLLRLKRKLTHADWRREGMGIWDDDAEGSRRWSADFWSGERVTRASAVDGVRSFAIAYSQDGERVSVSGAVKHDEGIHVELIAAHSGDTSDGVESLADWLSDRWREASMIAIVGAAGSALKQALHDRGVPEKVVRTMTTTDYFQANTMAEDALKSGSVTHPIGVEGDLLDASVAVCDAKKRGSSGQWGWVSTVPDGDETPVESFCAAYWAARTSKRVPGRKQVLI